MAAVTSAVVLPPPAGLAEELRALAHARTAAAWEAVVERAAVAMHRVAVRLVGWADADDVVQESLLLIRDHAGSFSPRAPTRDGQDEDALQWILRVTANAALQHRRAQGRRQRRHRRASLAAGPPTAPSSCTLEQQEAVHAARSALDALPEAQRATLVLHVLEGMTHEQVAAALGLPLGTTKSHIRRGLQHLQRRLGRTDAMVALAALAPLPVAGPDLALVARWRALLSAARTASVGMPGSTTTSLAGLIAGGVLAGVGLAWAGSLLLGILHPAPPRALAPAPALTRTAPPVEASAAAAPVAARRLSIAEGSHPLAEVLAAIGPVGGSAIGLEPAEAATRVVPFSCHGLTPEQACAAVARVCSAASVTDPTTHHVTLRLPTPALWRALPDLPLVVVRAPAGPAIPIPGQLPDPGVILTQCWLGSDRLLRCVEQDGRLIVAILYQDPRLVGFRTGGIHDEDATPRVGIGLFLAGHPDELALTPHGWEFAVDDTRLDLRQGNILLFSVVGDHLVLRQTGADLGVAPCRPLTAASLPERNVRHQTMVNLIGPLLVPPAAMPLAAAPGGPALPRMPTILHARAIVPCSDVVARVQAWLAQDADAQTLLQTAPLP